MRRAVCPGSFDPVTLGHLDVIGRAARLFDEVVVAVGGNPAKVGLFHPVERVEMLRAATADLPNVVVERFSGLLVEYCAERGAQAVVKGVRSTADVDHELTMSQMNASLSGLETVWLPTAPRWSFVSSSLVREVALLGGDVAAFLPPGVAEATARRVAERLRGADE